MNSVPDLRNPMNLQAIQFPPVARPFSSAFVNLPLPAAS
jgi:hypothetical protein